MKNEDLVGAATGYRKFVSVPSLGVEHLVLVLVCSMYTRSMGEAKQT